MSALFGGSTRTGAGKNLVEFRAGKMYMKGNTVHPDKRKGQVYVYQSEDTLMHFCWKDRSSGTVEEDLIIFPDDCEYKRVSQCTTGRVYVLRFKSTSRRLFFWVQEPKTDKDDENSRKVNELLNNPPAPGSQRSTGSTPNPVLGSDLSNLRDSDIHNFIGNISQQQLMQILGSGVPSLATLLGSGTTTTTTSSSSSSSSSTTASSTTANSTTTTSSTVTTTSTAPTATSTATTTPITTAVVSSEDSSRSGSAGTGGDESKSSSSSSTSVGPIQLSDLQTILSGISVPSDVAAASRIPVDLSSSMTGEALQPILTNEEFVDQLRPFLPPTGEPLPSAQQLRGTVSSPQFQQAVSLFSSALQSGQLGPLINQFGLGEEAVLAASSCDMEAFIKALGKKKESEGSKKEEGKKSEKDEDKDDDDSMDVD